MSESIVFSDKDRDYKQLLSTDELDKSDIGSDPMMTRKRPTSGSNHSERIHDLSKESGLTFAVLLDPGHADIMKSNTNISRHKDDRLLSVTATRSPTGSATATLKPLFEETRLTNYQIHLLKHYGRHVAPWLDIYDLGQTFGLQVPPLAMASPLVLDAVLKLAAVSLGAGGDGTEYADWHSDGFSNLQSVSHKLGQVPDFTVLQFLVMSVLLKAQIFVESVPDTWEHIFVAGGTVPTFGNRVFEDASHQRIWFGTIALMSRLELAYSMVNETAPAVGSHILSDVVAASETLMKETDGYQKLLHASLRCLALLTDIMSLCLQPPNQEGIPPPGQALPYVSPANRWKHLMSGLQEWHISRPLELQELVQHEGKDLSFPTVLFTSWAGVFSNIIYHVAMFLMLRHRPQTMESQQERDRTEATAAHVSPLWHARRVCGIAVSSDSQNTQCWDPCIIAAFSLAARRMTHPNQQTELLLCLDRIKASGWRIDSLTRRLRDEWGLFGPE
ncbi:hypothetical protein NKR23_g408 [Pleurostoma richardsiae]|uniref:Uncharacterized protein n=1 Tax=Pleurostoma richardsiae TaxID=41990 RepID=A0AA38S6P8_9PEZI|nr:hypothetical protein NKR23_g408 [Pleurostoma richardsiae]